MAKQPKILIIRFSSIGDIVLTTPVIRCLKKQLGADLHFLTKAAYTPILEANPYLSKIHTIDKQNSPLAEVVAKLKKEDYDYIIDLHKNLRSWYTRWKLGTKSYAFQKLNFQKWLLTQFKVDKLPNIHIVDRYLNTTKKLGVQNDNLGLDYFVPAKDNLDPKTLNLRLQPNQYIAFVIGATHSTKRLPAQKIKSICSKIDYPIVLIGAKGDQEAAKIVEQAGQQVINLCGQLNLNQSASIVAQSHQVIAHDTGFMHIAAAFQKDIISIWGNTVPQFGMYPYYPTGGEKGRIVETPKLACRPCSKIGYSSCPKGHFQCMGNIDEQRVLDHLDLP
ncbi:MAG: glycosyltransferase family 9 protein [Aureispira sp.]|nr:glycosyltransferase family 9 protein [Aureispira sp.]